MKNIKLTALILALIMVFSVLSGCGAKDNGDESSGNSVVPRDGYITTTEVFKEKISDLIDASLYNVSESEYDEISNTEGCAYTLKSENTKEYDLDYKIKLEDGAEFIVATSFSELEKNGWVLQESSNPDYEIEPGFEKGGIIQNSEGKELRVNAYNPTNKTIAFKECTVHKVYLEQYSDLDKKTKLSKASGFTICDSITNTSNIEEIIERLGNPNYVGCLIVHDDEGNYMYTTVRIEYVQKSSAYSSLNFDLLGDGNYIIKASYSIAPEWDEE